MPLHTHVGATIAAGEHTHTYTQYTLDQEVAETGSGVRGLNPANTQTGAFVTSSEGSHTHPVTISSEGGGLAHSNIQPVISVYYIIYIP